MSLSDYMHGSVEDEKKVAASAISNTINFLQNKLNNPLSVRQRDNYKTALKILGNPDNLHLVAKKIEGGSPAPQAIYNVYSTTAMAPKIMEGLIRYICDNRIGCRNYFEHVNNKGMMPGIINGMQLNTVNNYFEEKFHGARGHGFAAERANDLYDRLTGKDARIVGDDNAKDGADRIVNGVNIQSKYCSSGSRCVRECFRGDQFRYYNADGSPMQIEVPADKYDDAVRAMQDRIDKGQVRGAKRAEDIIRKGNVTYEQAKNITKFGTVESLKYDAANGVITGAYAGGISTAITFAVSRWQGKSFDEALQNSVRAGLQVGGISFAGAVVAGQLSKAGLNSALVNSSEALVSMMGPRASAQLVNAFRSGTNIYGAAAMKSASKLLRSNAITGAATVLVMSAGDVVNIFRGRISGAQLFKNVVNTTAEVAGGVGGWSAGAAAGAAIGTAVCPGIGTAVGGAIGGAAGAIAGSSAAGTVSQAVTDVLIEDDAKAMVRIIEIEWQRVAFDYLLSEREADQSMNELQIRLSDGSKLKDMYASNDRHGYARQLLIDCVEPIVRRRPRVKLPTAEELARGLRKVLER